MVRPMANEETRGDRLLKWFVKTKLFHFIAARIVVPFWAWKTPVQPRPGGPHPSVQPSDNVQCMMNLIMPLKEKTPIGRAKAAQAIAANREAIYAGLDNVGTVHFARFVIIDNNICMLSVYDGDFTNYIRDFIATIGNVFNAVVELVEDGDAVIPCEHHVEAFIEWVHERDLFQMPDVVTDILKDDTSRADQVDDLRSLPRRIVLQLRANANVSLGSGYRAYPGYSVAQVRRHLGIGW